MRCGALGIIWFGLVGNGRGRVVGGCQARLAGLQPPAAQFIVYFPAGLTPTTNKPTAGLSKKQSHTWRDDLQTLIQVPSE